MEALQLERKYTANSIKHQFNCPNIITFIRSKTPFALLSEISLSGNFICGNFNHKELQVEETSPTRNSHLMVSSSPRNFIYWELHQLGTSSTRNSIYLEFHLPGSLSTGNLSTWKSIYWEFYLSGTPPTGTKSCQDGMQA